MIDVARHINELLLTHNCVIVPGLGGFVANYQAAKKHPTSHIFNGPCKSIAFNVNLSNNDGLLVNKLVSAEYINIYDAEKSVTRFAEDIHSALRAGKTFKIPYIGRLTADSENNIQFLPDPSNNFLLQSYGLPSFEAKPVVRERTTPIKQVATEVEIPVEISPKSKVRKFKQVLIWSAAAILAISVFLQLFIQVKIKGNNYADVLGIDTYLQRHDIATKKYSPGIIKKHDYFLKYYRPTTAITDSIPVLLADMNVDEEISATLFKQDVGIVESKYWIIAGAFGKVEFAENVQQSLNESGYASNIIERNALFMIAVDVPSNASNIDFRNSFIQTTGIEDAWILRK